MSKIKTALITAGGMGTRTMPVTKSIKKEMLPLLDRPFIDYMVSDCIAAGIEEIIFVVPEGNTQVQDYYSYNNTVNKYLIRKGKSDIYEKIKDIHKKADFIYIEQSMGEHQKYGTSVPILLAQEYLEQQDAFVVLFGDDYVYHATGKNEVERMIEMYEAADVDGLVTTQEVPKEETYKYGIFKIVKDRVVDLVEKPSVENAPSTIANLGKFILTPKIFEFMREQEPNRDSGEYYFTDPVLSYCKHYDVIPYITKGVHLDGGTTLSWLKANLFMAMQRDDMREDVSQYFEALITNHEVD